MDSLQTLTPKAGSEIDTELEEEIQGGMAGPSSLSAQHQRRRFVQAESTPILPWDHVANASIFKPVLLVQLNEESLTMSSSNQVSIWEVQI